MKTKVMYLILVMIIMLPNVSHAQFGVVRRAINRQIDHKIDSSINKSAQDERDKKAKEEAEQGNSDNSGGKDNSGSKGKTTGLFGGKIDISHKDEYAFTGRIYMQMISYDKKDELKSDYYTYYNSTELNAGIEVKAVNPKEGQSTIPTVFLFDHDNRCFMMLMENNGSKTGIISTIPSDSALAAQAKNQKGEKPKQPVITKTGNSRTIAGYRCDEYKVVDPEKEGYSLIWMTKDVKLKADKRYWGKAGMPTYYNYPGMEGSMMLAMEAYDKSNNPEMKMETKEINDNFSHSISTMGYAFIKMNFGQAGKTGKK
jgi:hypothetical protein